MGIFEVKTKGRMNFGRKKILEYAIIEVEGIFGKIKNFIVKIENLGCVEKYLQITGYPRR